MKRCWTACALLAVGLLLACISPVSAQRMTGDFYVALAGDMNNWNELVSSQSGGSGWNANLQGPWFQYPQFWNQWYYDGVFDPNRYKIVDILFLYRRFNVNMAGNIEIWVNWSTPEWSATPNHGDGPPLVEFGPNNEPYLQRTLIQVLPIGEDPQYQYSTVGFRLPAPYNPEWVSIDVRGYNTNIWGGTLVHECVPEPSAVLSLLCGFAGLIGLRRRKA